MAGSGGRAGVAEGEPRPRDVGPEERAAAVRRDVELRVGEARRHRDRAAVLCHPDGRDGRPRAAGALAHLDLRGVAYRDDGQQRGLAWQPSARVLSFCCAPLSLWA